VRNVGNFGEVFDRNVGPNSKLDIPRGVNQNWNMGRYSICAADPLSDAIMTVGDGCGF
jgi:hypothetical protein